MNRTELPEPRCELEDRVVAAFLDGEPDLDASMLAAHLDECAACAEAVRQSRELESLLAAQTRTDVDDAVADRLLAGIDPCAMDTAAADPVGLGTVAPTAVARRPRWIGYAAAAALLVTVLGAAWVVGRERSGGRPEAPRVPAPEAKAVPLEAVPLNAEPLNAEPLNTAPLNTAPLPPSVVAQAPTGFLLPGSARRAHPRVEHKPPSDEDVLRRLEGESRPALDRRVLTARATAWLAPAPTADAAERSPAPVISPRHAAAAARWLFGEIRRGWLPADRALLTARRLLASRGRMRRELVAVVRAHEDVVMTLVRRRSYRGRPDGEAAALIGAVGSLALLPALRCLDADELAVCVREARRTGDTGCLTFLVDLYLDGAVRRADIRWSGAEWFRPTLTAAGSGGDGLADLIRRRAEMSRNGSRLALGDELLFRLGLAETCLIARAAAPRARRG